MSKVEKEMITCPECGGSSSFDVYKSLTITLDSEEYRRLCAESLFEFRCPHCGAVRNYNYPMLYHDVDHKTMIHYIYNLNIKEIRESIEKSKRIWGYVGECDQRIVTDRNVLKEKAQILHCDMDDRVVELTKFYYSSKYLTHIEDIKDKQVFFLDLDGKYYLQVLGVPNAFFDFPMDIYEMFQTKYGHILKLLKESYIVDYTWATCFLTLITR